MSDIKEVKKESFLSSLWRRIQTDDVSGLAAQLAYFFLLSLFPLILFLITLLPYLPISHEDILQVISSYAPPDSMKLIEDNVYEVMQGNNKVLSFGLIATLWSASNGLNAIVSAFNRAYDVEETRHFFVARMMSILLTIAMVFVFIVALLLPVFGKQIGIFLLTNFGWSDEFIHIWNTATWIISSIVILFVFTILYWLAPNKKIRCLSVLPGAIFAVAGWSGVSYAFSFYVEKFDHYSTTYGSVGGIIALMIWFYLSGVIIIIGGEINAIRSEYQDPKCG
jgi:membrane protein